MKKFIKKILILQFGLIILYALFYFVYSEYLNSSFSNEKAVFIWGDSQAYFGLDVQKLSSSLDKKVFTSAIPGAGIYDFLLFTEQVPENSEVIVSISKLVQIRRKENDFNRSGFSLWALKKMSDNDYSISEINSIIKLNLKPRKNISETTKLFAYSDSMEIGLPLSHFKNYYKEVPSFLRNKQELYLIGIKNLISKKCKISFLEFPYHSLLEDIEKESQIKKRTDDFKNEIGKLFKEFEIDTISLVNNRNIFKDLSHLNCIGAENLSQELAIKLLKNQPTTIYTVKKSSL